jgi:hypothetical protein
VIRGDRALMEQRSPIAFLESKARKTRQWNGLPFLSHMCTGQRSVVMPGNAIIEGHPHWTASWAKKAVHHIANWPCPISTHVPHLSNCPPIKNSEYFIYFTISSIIFPSCSYPSPILSHLFPAIHALPPKHPVVQRLTAARWRVASQLPDGPEGWQHGAETALLRRQQLGSWDQKHGIPMSMSYRAYILYLVFTMYLSLLYVYHCVHTYIIRYKHIYIIIKHIDYVCIHEWIKWWIPQIFVFSIVHVQLIQTWGVMPIQASQFKTRRFAWRCSFDSLRCSAGIPALLRHPRGEAPSVLGGFTQSWWIVKLQ